MKQVLVLGGTRFFGIHLVKSLLEQGAGVTLATRGLTPDPVSYTHLDVYKRQEYRRPDNNS